MDAAWQLRVQAFQGNVSIGGALAVLLVTGTVGGYTSAAKVNTFRDGGGPPGVRLRPALRHKNAALHGFF